MSRFERLLKSGFQLRLRALSILLCRVLDITSGSLTQYARVSEYELQAKNQCQS
jgi:hypothetical protein